MQYDCYLEHRLVYKDGAVCQFRWLKLPFAPFKGLWLDLPEGSYYEVRFVAWDVESGHFLLSDVWRSAEECSCSDTDDCCRLEPRERYERDGWSVSEYEKHEAEAPPCNA